MVRLLARAHDRAGDGEIFAGLVQACRFCGLLDASVAAHVLARRRDPTLVTSVMHTYFVMRRYDEVVASHGAVKGYVFALSLAGLGRTAEAIALLGHLEKQEQRLPQGLLMAARGLIEGNRAKSLAGLDETAATAQGDPELYFYWARHYATLGEPARALPLLARSIDGGYYCYESLAGDPWFGRLRDLPPFQALVERARAGRDLALDGFRHAGGVSILAV